MSKQQPSVGRIVHFVDEAETHRAAIITAVDADACELCVFNANGPGMVGSIKQDEEGKASFTWHFCEFVPPVEVTNEQAN